MKVQQSQMPCSQVALSDKYIDVLVTYNGNLDDIIETYNAHCVQIIDDEYAIIYVPIETPSECLLLFQRFLPESIIAAGPLGKSGLIASGILYFHNLRNAELKGNEVLIAVIDTGIDYTHKVFLDSKNQTRIVSIWDQTSLGNPPEGYIFGTEYTREAINRALSSPNPYEIVPEVDLSGHGTFLAGVAAGSQNGTEFIGTAPETELNIVKVKGQI